MNAIQRVAKSLRGFFAPSSKDRSGSPREARNVTRGTVLASRLELAGTGETRRKGLLGRKNLPPGDGLWIAPCESVHTFFMRFAIDLVYLDRNLQVRKVRSNVGPWRLSACLRAHSVLELPAGTVNATRTQRGDVVELGSANLAVE